MPFFLAFLVLTTISVPMMALSQLGRLAEAKSAGVHDSRVNSDASANKNKGTRLLLDETMSPR